MLTTATAVDEALLEDLALLEKRPFDFVLYSFPWGEEGGELAERDGPDDWQRDLLLDIQDKLLSGYCDSWGAIQEAVKSGHGVGKSALVSWIVLWAMSTAPDTRGRVTANTEKQLRTVLWAEIAKWHGLFIGRHLFKMTATALYSSDPAREKNWRCDAVPWSEDNPEAFAGLHNFGKRLFVIFDEASAISDKIWEVVDGAMTDANTELLWLATGNPTRNFGRFHDCFHKAGWTTRTVSSEDSKFSNKEQLKKWREAWGWDSDFYRVRVRGEFPNSSELQLIPVESVLLARKAQPLAHFMDPLLLALDVARFGSNESVAAFRRGKDARTLPAQRWRGLSVVETANRIVSLATAHDVDALFIDEGGVGGGVVDVVRSLGFSCLAVNFGGTPGIHPNGTRVGNKRAEMYVALRDWLREGGAIEDADDLHEQLVSIEYHFNKKTEIMLMAKEDMRLLGRPSPDWADALAMTFAYPVAAKARRWRKPLVSEYDPLSQAAFEAASMELH